MPGDTDPSRRADRSDVENYRRPGNGSAGTTSARTLADVVEATDGRVGWDRLTDRAHGLLERED